MCYGVELLKTKRKLLQNYTQTASTMIEALAVIRKTKSFDIETSKSPTDITYILEMACHGHKFLCSNAPVIPDIANVTMHLDHWFNMVYVFGDMGIQPQYVRNEITSLALFLKLIGTPQKLYSHDMPSLIQAEQFFLKLYDRAIQASIIAYPLHAEDD